jgi:DNA-directed RNA polymerase subunit beta'
MLEVNDFNAVRISLASPEKIRSWSFGEVTKPETINYRTLKPEKDGLFCERIFGPTKDWECYCGKYKRVRYKGIVCEKCGVEVARAKVRRERMGHIALAAPVSHIWFVKGTPSRIGLLLDKSPRELERVLYFASYIIIEVNEERRAELLAEIDAQLAQRRAELEGGQQERAATLQDELSRLRAEIEERRQAQRAEAEADRDARLAELDAERAAAAEKLAAWRGQGAPETLAFRETTIVREGEAVNAERIALLEERYADERQAIISAVEVQLSDIDLRADAEIAAHQAQLDRQRQEMADAVDSEMAALEESLKATRRELEELQPLKLLTEAQYRELWERWGDRGLFRAEMGAEAIREIIAGIDLDKLREELREEIAAAPAAGQRRKKAIKRLKVVEAFRRSGNRPEWMIFTILPVLPPDLRPMVQLDGGRFATSDLNDLYRRVINRNNRLKRLIELGAPEIIIRNEKRMLQEAVDSLIDNGRRGRAVSGASNHKLKSLSDMLKGKQGRFRQNLLGKRVDYSGRSVIVVGPNLKLHQCGLPKRMALELFKPFVMRRLVERGLAHNIKSAKRLVERMRPEVWDALEEVIQDHPVLLNRAPTLHRLGIQAFEPVLVDGSAIQIHPLVCAAFGADFDGDQMAVHVPLSAAAQDEARVLMLSVYNLLSPASGEPIVAPTLDIVLGCYYLTVLRPGAKGEGRIFTSADEARLAYELGHVHLQAPIKVRVTRWSAEQGAEVEELVSTSVGRLIFNEILPPRLRFTHLTEQPLDKKALKNLVAECYRLYGTAKTVELVDSIKALGFAYATRSGITIAISDIGERELLVRRNELLQEADKQISDIQRQYRRGLITEDERYAQAIEIWSHTREQVTKAVQQSLDPFGSVFMMTGSGAKGNIQQLTQMAAMRGLMAAPSGKIIEMPIRSSFREGLSVLEYFISTHGARKGLADTAIRTADSGYLTRRLIDVAQDVIVLAEDCGTAEGIWIERQHEAGLLESLSERIAGRLAASDVRYPEDHAERPGELIVARNEMITDELAQEIERAGVERVHVRSVLTCAARQGVCQRCYGRNLARGGLVNLGEAVGIIAAESIGEPGTQLTMRTFHTGGVAGRDITSGLPRVEELFEARSPKSQAIISEIDGLVEVVRTEDERRIRVVSEERYPYEHPVPPDAELLVETGDEVAVGQPLARRGDDEVRAHVAGSVRIEAGRVIVDYVEREEREYLVPAAARILVETGQRVLAGDLLTDGDASPKDVLRIKGREAVQQYLVDEVQRVYRSQGVTINDKHIEVIVRQMLRRVQVESGGDTDLLAGEIVDRFVYEDKNAKVLAEGGEPATAQTVLLGVTKAALLTDSFLAAASFQETTRVLTEAAVEGKVDRLVGLKENVIIGKLIPAGSGLRLRSERALYEAARARRALGAGEEAEGPDRGIVYLHGQPELTLPGGGGAWMGGSSADEDADGIRETFAARSDETADDRDEDEEEL